MILSLPSLNIKNISSPHEPPSLELVSQSRSAKTTGNSADEVIDAVKAGDDVVDDVVKTGDDVVDDVVKTSSKEGGSWGEEIFIMFKDGNLTREDALRLLKDDREAMER